MQEVKPQLQEQATGEQGESTRADLHSRGKDRVEGNSTEPLSDEALRHFQKEVDAAHDTFIADIVRGRGRGLTADRVRKGFGEGRMVDASGAMRRGMVDRRFPTTTRESRAPCKTTSTHG